MTLGAHAGYGISASGWADSQGLLHFSQMVGVFGAAGYPVAPNVRRLLRLSSGKADPERDR